MALTDTEFARVRMLGSYATALLADETFREVLKELKNETIRNWAEAQSPDKREDFWRDLQAVARLENFLAAIGQKYRTESSKLEALKEKNVRDAYRRAARG
jgi:hypothetical protein